MIRLNKTPIPEILRARAAEWVNAIMTKLARGEEPTKAEIGRYRHADVKSALVAETHGKCAYCESKLRHIAHGDIEHIVPKSRAPERTFDWINLTLACDLCNENKGTHPGNHDDFVDPYVVDPADHLAFVGPLVFPRPGSTAGFLTERLLELNRAELVERRKERLNALHALLVVMGQVANEHLRDVLRSDVEKHETAAHQEFAAMSRQFVQMMLPPLAAVAAGNSKPSA